MSASDTEKRPALTLHGVQATPLLDHLDGLRAALLELGERCGEVRRIVDSRFRRSSATNMLRERLMAIAETAMRASMSTGILFDGMAGNGRLRLIWDAGLNVEVSEAEKEMQQKAADLLAASGIFNLDQWCYTVHVVPHEPGA